MPMRFKLLAGVFFVMLLVAHNSGMRPFGNVADVFAALGVLLALSILAPWPSETRTERVERKLSGSTWADRLDIEAAAREVNGDHS